MFNWFKRTSPKPARLTDRRANVIIDSFRASLPEVALIYDASELPYPREEIAAALAHATASERHRQQTRPSWECEQELRSLAFLTETLGSYRDIAPEDREAVAHINAEYLVGSGADGGPKNQRLEYGALERAQAIRRKYPLPPAPEAKRSDPVPR